MSTVKIKRSGTTTSTPSSLDHGELAINYADSTLFWKDATNTIKSFVFQAYAALSGATFTGAVEFDRTVANSSATALVVDGNFSTTSSAEVVTLGVFSDVRKTVSSGVTDSGKLFGGQFDAVADGDGTLAEAYGVYARAVNLGDGNLTTATAIYAHVIGGTTGYGVYIAAGSATTSWGVYQAGTEKNYFGGNVGIGVSPTSALNVSGNATFEASSGVPVTITNTGTGNSFVVNDQASDTTPFVITASGNVGVGVSSPIAAVSSQSLDVSGPVLSRGRVASVPTGAAVMQLLDNTLQLRAYGATSGTGIIDLRTGGGGGSDDTLALRLDASQNATFSGVIVADDSTSTSAPVYSFTSDLNSGIAHPAADTVAISTAGTERLRVGSTGFVGVGSAPSSVYRFLIDGDVSAAAGGVFQTRGVIQSGAATFLGISSAPTIASGATLTNLYHFYATAGTFTGTATNQSGFYADSALTGATSNYGFRGIITAASGRWNVYMDGTAQNYFAGNVGIGASRTTPATALDVNGVITVAAGSAAAPAIVASGDSNTGAFFPAADTFAISTAGVERVRVRSDGVLGIGNAGFANTAFALGNSTSSTGATHVGLYSAPTFNSAGTSLFNFYSEPQTAGSAVTLLVGFTAVPHLGGGTVTTAVGFRVTTGFTSGSTNYGFQSSIASGSNRWNAYFDGTAPNYFAGNVGIGSGTTSPTAALDINAEKIRLRTAKTPASASDTGNAGDICWDDSYLYICTATNTWRRIAHSTW